MSSRRHKGKNPNQHKRNKHIAKDKTISTKVPLHRDFPLSSDSNKQKKAFEIFVIMILLVFGIYHSILYFGHQVVPNPDFTAFVRVGHELLSFQLPSDYKRVPVLGLLQASLSYLVGGQHPDLTAGWLLNAILHPFNIVLLWLVCKRVVGRASPWFAIIAIINPWTIQLLAEPIAETTLLFFILLTLFFILRRSKWCYLFASITTMVRYEGAALILAAFILDMIYSEDRKQRIRAFGYAFLAVIPLAIWMLGTTATWRGGEGTHYLKVFGQAGNNKFFWIRFVNSIWNSSFYPLFQPVPTASKAVFNFVSSVSKTLVLGSFVFGAVYGLCKRRWNILALLIFILPYILIHSVFSVVISRYTVPVNWAVLLICFYGLQSIWKLIDKDSRIPRALITVLQGILLLFVVVWLISLIRYLPRTAPISWRSVSLPYFGIALVALIFVGLRFVYKTRYLWRDLVVSMLICLIIISNQFVLVWVVHNGQRDVEFKKLADWYLVNTDPGEKMCSTMSNLVAIFAPKRKGDLVHTGSFNAPNATEFALECHEKGITYIAWDSRLGLVPRDTYYKLWGLKNIAMLAKPQDIGPYEFIVHIEVSKRRFVNVFRLREQSLNLSLQ